MGRDQHPELGGRGPALGRGKGSGRERRAEVDAADAAGENVQNRPVVLVGDHPEQKIDRPIRGIAGQGRTFRLQRLFFLRSAHDSRYIIRET